MLWCLIWICSSEFDKLVEGSKDDAEDALKRIPEIERLIEDAESATADANFNLADALRDANVARSTGSNAAEVATMAADVRCNFNVLVLRERE